MKRVIDKLSLFWTVLYCLNRRAELIRLVRWSKRKRLSGPLRCYLTRLQEEEIRLNSYTVRTPHLVKWTLRFHWFNDLILAAPRYPQAGTAAAYRRYNLTSQYKKTYSKSNYLT